MTQKKDPNFEEKLTFCLKNDVRNLVNFNPRSGKSENLHFNGQQVYIERSGPFKSEPVNFIKKIFIRIKKFLHASKNLYTHQKN